ncbi:MAG: sialate O-acetylesterase [Verrucomicrobiales bacterium]|nr:sialate O-acetylesterase [Verrucomicrobiales bacterium]
MKFLFLIFFAGCLPMWTASALDLHPLFTDHAVLQQDMQVPVWGTAKAGELVTVEFSGQKVSSKADESGAWMVVLAPLAMNASPSALTASAASESIAVEGVLVGEVWVASGQSNMGMTVGRTFDAESAARAAESGAYPNLRLFRTPVEGSDSRASTVDTQWSLPTAPAVDRFSAVAFFFGAKLAQDRSVPVGLIQAANGGTNAYSWINSETLESDPAAEAVRSYWAAALKNLPESMERYKTALAKFREKAKAAKENGESFSERAPREPVGPDHVKRPAGHYNAMVAPLQPYAIRGAIWYQGEANSRVPFYSGYKDLMFALVEDWRADWAGASGGLIERRDFPFYLVQLPNFAGGSPEGWPGIREQMLHFWQEGKNTGMVVAIDKGEANDIHPRDKKPVGERLARFARADTYGENIVYSGPIFESLRIEGDKARIAFTYLGGGLASGDGEPLRHFEIAGADQKFVPASAKIEGDAVVVKSELVPEPRAVRYAWTTNPEEINFFNEEGLPASPFRTDSW